jgi:putative oxidoreductase
VTAAGHAIEYASTVRAWFETARRWLARFPLSIIQLAMRVAVGAVLFNSGLLKINSWEFAIKLFEDEYKVPLLDPVWAARLATFNELTFSVLLVVGLTTRLATLPLLGMIAVIQTFVYPQAWPEHLLWTSILVFLLTRGPGEWSLDHFIERWIVRKADRQSEPRLPGSDPGERLA